MTLTIETTIYGKLLSESQPRVIHGESEYDRALEIVDALMSKTDLTPEETELLEVWAILIEAYEEQNYPMPEATPHEVLLHLMEVKEIRQVDLTGILGSKGVVSEIVNGKRSISKAQAKALGEFFKVNPSLFI
ncbi:MAG: transcriptional regulator [Acaryochloridaceae cyanobacterium RU_4_10]|nr:transcriptional regulator [Acaryochloridaceae cyanobacterium RU_4_10]